VQGCTLHPGDVYGELSIVHGTIHSSTFCSNSNSSEAFVIHRKMFHSCVRFAAQQDLVDKMEHLQSCTLFQSLDASTLLRVAESTKSILVHQHERVIKQGDVGHEFFSIKSGEVSVWVNNQSQQHVKQKVKQKQQQQQVATLADGEYFGEMALLTENGIRTADVMCETESAILYVLTKKNFDLLLGPIRHLMLEVSEQRQNDLETMKATAAVTATATITATTTTTSKQRSISMDCAISEIKQIGRRQSMAIVLQSKNENNKNMTAATTGIDLNDFIDVGKLGQGSFGSVRLVRMKQNASMIYALKIISKDIVQEALQIKNIQREKELLLLAGWGNDVNGAADNNTTSAPNASVVTLHGTAQDAENLYMLLDVVPGGELAALIDNPRMYPNLNGIYGGLSNHAVQFMTGCIVSLLALLHTKSIAFRDLKPENLIIDCSGYLVVVDFGFSKIVPLHTTNKTFTLCGSPEYLAPEVIVRRGHDLSVDYWSLGIIIYELLFGSTPFYSESHRNIFKNVLAGKIDFSVNNFEQDILINEACKNLITRLLDPTPSTRLGALLNGIGGILNHSYFDHFDWDAFGRREMIPPCIPILNENGVASLVSDDEDESGEESGNESGEEKRSNTKDPLWSSSWNAARIEEGDYDIWNGW
jgi:serine/threonine protein kinase/CRP-like cAMP-binding protein